VGGAAPPDGDAAKDDTLPAAAKLVAAAADALGNAETMATPRSDGRPPSVRSGRAAAPTPGDPSLGHAETLSGRSTSGPSPASPGGADEVKVTPGTQLGKRYRVADHLGAGGMGVVYAGHDLLVDQAVALKFIRPSLAADFRERERLRAEVRLAQSVTHVNVCRTYTLDEIDGHLFIVMELLRGPTLSAKLREGLLSVDDALRLARDLLVGLTAAHSRGILHRDIKPGNVKIADDGRAVLMDFGMARTSESATPAIPVQQLDSKIKVQITHTLLGGTPGYIAPEILRGKRGDVRADLYSFGVMLFEMLTGRAPFAGASPHEMIVKHLDEAAPRVDALRPEVPAHVADVVARLLAKEPQGRPPGAEATRRLLEGLPETGDTPSSRGLDSARRVAAEVESARVAAAAMATEPASVPTVRTPRRGRRMLLVGGVAAVVLAGGIAIVAGRGGHGAEPKGQAPPATRGVTPPAAADAAPMQVAAPPVADAAPLAIAPPDAGVADKPRGKSGRKVVVGGGTQGKTTDGPQQTTQGKDEKDDAAERRRKQLELEQ
jgi:tRNA A-37 threonylcarbamoyl transferase component Bud32